ncbi:MAG: hypothetical protein COA44_08490 [Arcobacter sp.]|nr:MAG: hypothetical protein COA44_08490 [Arcobacter sp.]
MEVCIKSSRHCLGRDSKSLSTKEHQKICCKEEIVEEKYIAQNIIDCIDDCSNIHESILNLSSKLSYASHVINTNNDHNLLEIIPVIKRFSFLLYEFKEKILNDNTISELTCSFARDIRTWFAYQFLRENYPYAHPVNKQSILADINTIEMALGVCAIVEFDEASLDSLFF